MNTTSCPPSVATANPSPPPQAIPQRSIRQQTQRRKPANRLVFSPLAWLKLMFFLHAGDTEIGGFAISSEHDPLYIEQFVTLDQTVSCVTVHFADDAVADHFDRCVDAGLKPERFARIWCHTHPGESPEPSGTDEQTFARVFGPCDWSVMFIVGRTGRTYCRLAFSAGPSANLLLPVVVDWAAWPEEILTADLDEQMAQWTSEYENHIHPERFLGFEHFGDPEMDLRDIEGLDVDRLGMSGWWDFEDYEPRYPEHASISPVRDSLASGIEVRS